MEDETPIRTALADVLAGEGHRTSPRPRAWTIDCGAGKAPDLWLRDGDMVEVPDK